MSMHILTDRAAWLMTGITGQGTGSALDTRACKDYGLLYWALGKAGSGTGASAVLTFQASFNSSGEWLNVYQLTATATQTGTAQLVGFFPFVRASAGPLWTASGAAGTGTGVVNMHWSPGLV